MKKGETLDDAPRRTSRPARRKKAHVKVCLEEDVRHRRLTAGFERLRLPYAGLPELDLADVDLSCGMLGKRLSMPFMILGMTGGAGLSGTINRNLATAAQECGVALGLGSMRIALEDPGAAESFRVRCLCPDVPLWANLGAVQLNNGCGVEECRRLVELADADGLCLHVNALQEVAQVGGDTNWGGLAEKIGALAEALPVPVMVKEVGFGMNQRMAKALAELPIWGIDVSGAGGTSWLRVEQLVWDREDLDGFEEFGTPTARSIREVRDACPDRFIVGSGGVRSGLDAVKAIALGSDVAGAALPFLAPAVDSAAAVVRRLETLRHGMRVAAFAAGAGDKAAIRNLELDPLDGRLVPAEQEADKG